jgi:hypothetical protein
MGVLPIARACARARSTRHAGWLEQHAEVVERRLQEVLAQQARLAEKLSWYRAELIAGR